MLRLAEITVASRRVVKAMQRDSHTPSHVLSVTTSRIPAEHCPKQKISTDRLRQFSYIPTVSRNFYVCAVLLYEHVHETTSTVKTQKSSITRTPEQPIDPPYLLP